MAGISTCDIGKTLDLQFSDAALLNPKTAERREGGQLEPPSPPVVFRKMYHLKRG